MKLSITNAGLNSKVGYKESLRLIKDAGFDAVDYDLSARGEDHQLGEDYVAEAKEMRAYMDKIGLECAQTHGPFPVMYNKPFDETYSQSYTRLKCPSSISARPLTITVISTKSLNPTQRNSVLRSR